MAFPGKSALGRAYLGVATLAEQSQRPIVVGVDGTAGSQLALWWAVREAQLHGLPVRIVTATKSPGSSVLSASTRIERVPRLIYPPRDDHERAMAYAGDRLLGGMVSGSYVPGSATRILLDEASQAEMIVVGARGRSSIGAAVLGSVSSTVAARATRPVVVVSSMGADLRERGRVLVGVDGSQHSELALGFAFDEAAYHGSALCVVYCREANDVPAAPPAQSSPTDEQPRWMQDSIARSRVKHPNVPLSVELSDADPAAALTDQSRHAALVVVGSRGRGAVTGLLLGSVSQGVLRHAHCPVAVIHKQI